MLVKTKDVDGEIAERRNFQAPIQGLSNSKGEIDPNKKRILYGMRTSTKIFDTMSMQSRK